MTIATIDNISHTYSKTKNAELEIRFDSKQLKKDWYMTLLNTTIATGIPAFEQTINLLSDTSNGYDAQQIVFVDGVKQSDMTTKYAKNKISRTDHINGLIPYRLVLSTENPITSMGVPNLARIKLRLSIHNYPGMIDWRIDFTFTKQLNVNKKQLIDYRDKMFQKYDMDKFIEQAPWLFADQYELEIEHVGKDKTNITETTIQNIVNVVYKIISPEHKQMEVYQNAIYDVAQVIFPPQRAALFRVRFGLKRLFNAVKEMNRTNYFIDIFTKIQQFYATIKADGNRVIGHASNDTLKIIGHDLTTIKLSNPVTHDIIVDAEYVNNKLMVFDVMAIDGVNISQKPFSDRIKSIVPAVMALDKNAVPKKYIKLSDSWATDLKTLWEEEYPHEVDGIIFNSESGSYQQMEVWKWKPVDKMSVDFMTIKAPTELLGTKHHHQIKEHTMMILFCSIRSGQFKSSHIQKIPYYNKMFPNQSNHDIFPIQFSAPDNTTAYIYHHPNDSTISVDDMSGHICEYNYTDAKWVLMRIRYDRDVDVKRGVFFGNNYHVAMTIWNNFSNPLLFSDIISPTPDKMGYFVKHDSAAHKSIRSFHSFIKSKVMSKFFKRSRWLVDLGGGKGQDMFRYSKLNITNAVIVDNDREALSKVTSKMFSHKQQVGHYNTRLYTKYVDLSEPYLDNIRKLSMLPNDGIPSVMCNFALHYFMATKATARNIINMVNTMIGSAAKQPGGGTFMFVVLNGKRVFDLLRKTKEGDSIDFIDDSVTKFSIKRMYTSNQFMDVGQKIGMILPFSDQKYYEEYLVNVDFVVGTFRDLGYTVVLNKGFEYWLDMAAIENSNMFSNLTDTDKSYTKLHQVVVMNKTVKTNKQRMKVEEHKLFKQGLGAFPKEGIGLPQIHKCRIVQKWFELVKTGAKTVEGRLNKGTFSNINPGDIIEFTKSGSDDTIRVKVIDVKKYTTFEAMFGTDGENVENVLPGVTTVTQAVKLYHKIYKPNMVSKFGVVAAHIQRI